MPKRNYRRRFNRRRAKKTGGLKAIVKKEVKSIMSRKMEHKYYYSTWGTATIGTGYNIQEVTMPIQGARDVDRVGDKIDVIKLTITTNFTPSSSSGTALRFIVFQWRPDNGSVAPTASDILLSATSPLILTSNYGHDRKSEYNILLDKLIAFPAYGYAKPYYRRFIIKKFSHQIKFTAGGATGCGHIFMLLVGSDNTLQTAFMVTYHVDYTDA